MYSKDKVTNPGSDGIENNGDISQMNCYTCEVVRSWGLSVLLSFSCNA